MPDTAPLCRGDRRSGHSPARNRISPTLLREPYVSASENGDDHLARLRSLLQGREDLHAWVEGGLRKAAKNVNGLPLLSPRDLTVWTILGR